MPRPPRFLPGAKGGDVAFKADNHVVRVLVSSRAPSHILKYVDQLIGDNSAGGAPGGVELEFRADPTRPTDVDVVHVPSTSAVIGDSRTSEREQVRRARRLAKILKRRRVALVRTLPQDAAGVDRSAPAAEAILDQATTSYIAFSTAVTAPHDRAVIVIPHSHLRHRFLGYPQAAPISGRLLIVSSGALLRSYEPTLKVYAFADLPGCTLRIVGMVPTALEDSFARTLSRHAATISLCDDVLSDGARILEITRSELVVIAAPDNDESVSTIMLALSLDRPVLVESTPATRQLADEVGHDWVRLHNGALTPATLEAAIRSLREAPVIGQPNLTARDPNVIARWYADAFSAASASR